MNDASKIKCSLRSVSSDQARSDSSDTTRISEAYGGGGHHNASAFILDLATFNEWT